MTFIQIYLSCGAFILAMMTVLWALSLGLKNASIVDIFWGTGFVIVAWFAFLLAPGGLGLRKGILIGLVTVWGLRLSLHILGRNWGKGEDFRYQVWRREAGAAWWWRSYFKVFLLQGVILWIVATPLIAVQSSPVPQHLTWLDLLALALWGLGFFFETVGDAQLARFKADPANKGRVLQSGVWRTTRHPNYFGDAAQWWAYYLIAIAAGAWWTFFSPLLMTGLLLRVSGVTLLEKTLVEEKPEYRAYIETTSEFIPWFRRRS